MDPTTENEGKLASARQKGAMVSALLIPGDAVTTVIFEVLFGESVVATSPLTTGIALASAGSASRTL